MRTRSVVWALSGAVLAMGCGGSGANGDPAVETPSGASAQSPFLITPTSLDFGEVAPGAVSPTQTVTVTNVGATPVVMSGAGGAPGGPFDGSQDCQGQTLAPGATCHMYFDFAPTSAGPATATSSGTWNGVPFSIALSGTGTASPSAPLLITPTGLEFGDVSVGSTSPTQTVTIINAGSAPVVMSGAGGAPGGAFNGVQDCQGQTLAPGGSCHMFFTFDPTAPGEASGASVGTWNGVPFTIALHGTGVAPLFLITPTALAFGSVRLGDTSPQQIVTITNVGTAPVVMSGAGGAPGGEFNGVQDCQGQTLAPGASCHMYFSFAPTIAGPATATSVGSWNGVPFSIPLTGEGVAPRLLITPVGLDFGEIVAGQVSPTQKVAITNEDSSPIVMSGAGGAPGGAFNGVQDCQGQTLAPGASCHMYFTFEPTVTGPATATSVGSWNGVPFSIPLTGVGIASDADRTAQFLVTPTALEFGSVRVGDTSPQQTVTITNVGAAPVVMSGAGGAPGGAFNGVQDCQGQTLAPGASCHMFFTFIPTAAGSASATSNGNWNGVPFSIPLHGTGALPSLLITPVALEFGNVVLGNTSPQQVVTITNEDASPIVMSGAGGAPGGDFNGVQDCQGQTLASGASCHMFFTFAPTAVGSASATSNGNWNGVPFAIALHGNGVPPSILVAPAAIEFGTVAVGSTSATQTVTITNFGTTPLVMSGAGGAPGAPFNAFQDCQGQTLAPGGSCHMFFTFTPTAPGSASGSSNGTWSGVPFSIALHGTGAAPSLLIAPAAVEFGSVTVGTTSPVQTVTITNTGPTAIVMSGAGGAPGAPFGASQDCQGQPLAPGAACHMFYTFSPTTAGSASGVSAGTWNGVAFSIALHGTGVAARLRIAPQLLVFLTPVGQTSTQVVRVTNVGAAPVVMNGTGGGASPPFGMSQSCQGTTLAPGASCNMSYTFSPTARGLAAAISSGAWNGVPYKILLTGFAFPPRA